MNNQLNLFIGDYFQRVAAVKYSVMKLFKSK